MSLRNRQVAKSANILKDFKVSLAAVMILEIHKGLALQVYRSWIPTDSYGFLWLFMDRGSLAIPNFSVGNLEIWKSGTGSNKTSAPTLPKAYTPRLKNFNAEQDSNIESSRSSFVCCVSMRVFVLALENTGKP